MAPVGSFDEVGDGRVELLDAGGRQVLLARVGEEIYATEPRCPHARSVLGPGRLSAGGLIECPMHGALFSPSDGVPRKGPTCAGLETYPVEIRGGTVYVDFEAARPRPDAPASLNQNAGPWDKWSPAAIDGR